MITANIPKSIWNAGGKMFFGTRKYYTEKYVNEKLKNGITDQYVDYITGCFMVVNRQHSQNKAG